MLQSLYQQHVRLIIHRSSKLCAPYSIRNISDGVDVFAKKGLLHFEIPQRLRQKVISLEDAVSLVRDGDTVSCSGFVAQGNFYIVRSVIFEYHPFSSQAGSNFSFSQYFFEWSL